MIRNRLTLTLAGLAILLPSLCWSALPDLAVHVINAKTASGTIEVSLFNSSESFLKQVHLQQAGTADENGELTVVFAALDEGEYAVVVVHDENGNEKYDSGILGFGSEGLGYSNNVRPWFSRPEFEEVKFSVESESREIEISLD